MKYAVIRLAGRQFKVEEGQKFEISKTEQVKPEVLLLVDGDKIEIGEPVLTTVKVETTVLEEKRGKKVEIRRYKAKTRYRRKIGHRQPMMILEVGKIGEESSKKVVKKVSKPIVEEKPVSKAASKPEVSSTKKLERSATSKKTAVATAKKVKKTTAKP